MGKAKERKGRRQRNASLSRVHPADRSEPTVTHKTKLGQRHLFSCNHEGCGATFENAGTYKAVWEQARAAGWRALKVGAVWRHWCCWVHIPSDRVLADADPSKSKRASDTSG